MLPQRPAALDPDFMPEFTSGEAARFSQGETECAMGTEMGNKVDHHCQICPTCSARLSGHRCKLVCTQCGYYLSCADYY